MIRTGYSFRKAYGHLDAVLKRTQEIGLSAAPIADYCSTFGFVRWSKLCAKAGIKPVYGVELAVSPNVGEKKPTVDHWTFIAKDSLQPLHELIGFATSNAAREPMLNYEQVKIYGKNLFKIAGERSRLDYFSPEDEVFIGLSPAVNKGYFKAVKAAGFQFVARSDNLYPTAQDKEAYRVALGRRSVTQTYPQWILSDDEWRATVSAVASPEDINQALANRNEILAASRATLVKAELLKPERTKTLRQLCEEGAAKLNCDLEDPVYAARLDREIKLIEEKGFDDYIFIIADMVSWAKERMIVGPARGSSCGSLVCYLTGITAIDPIPFGLMFERFVDVNRNDLPDIDIDFSDERRELVFNYAEEKYGFSHVGRLGTVSIFRPRSALNQAVASLAIPKWLVEKTLDGVIIRSGGDSRALQTLEDTLADTEMGRKLLTEYPEAKIAAQFEGHPVNSSQHAAGIVITEKPLTHYVAVNSHTRSIMCDKEDAEELNLLKIDALGLTQLSIFERTLELIGEEPKSGWLERLPLDDQAAFDVLNRGHFAGVFQFMGGTLKSLTKQIHIDKLEDLVAITALARPGPMATGGAITWVKRRIGQESVTYPHAAFEPYLKETLGIVTYQEDVLKIGREIGELSWEDVTQLRKAMSKSLGAEYFDQYGDKWKAGAAKKGIDPQLLDGIWRDLCAYGAWCLSGNTIIQNPYPNQSRKANLTIKELYKLHSNRRIDKPVVFSLKDKKTILPSKLIDVFYSGKKQTFQLKVASGEKIRATKEHRFLTDELEWKKLGHLKVGDKVVLVGKTELTERKKKKGIGRGGQNWWPLLKDGKPLFKRQVELLKRRFKRCQRCLSAPYQETHHINGDHFDHALDNLLPVCRSCHRHLHGPVIAHSKGRGIRFEQIVSIDKQQIEDVYDIQMPTGNENFLANDFIVHNSFNKSHAVAYGMVSYWCCWLKAHHPLEFAAATLDAEKDPVKQINILRELQEEGIDYVPVDAQHSGARWSIMTREDGKKLLVGPLTQIKGIGPKNLIRILECRKKGEELPPKLESLINNARTEIDTLYPIADAIKKLHPDLSEKIVTRIAPIQEVQCGVNDEVVILGVAKKIAPKDENEDVNVKRRGGKRVAGPSAALNLFVADDKDEIFVKVDRFKFEKLGRPIVERGRAGNALYAIKGRCPPFFRMLTVTNTMYLGDIDDAIRLERSDD